MIDYYFYHEYLEEFFNHIDPNNPEFPEDFDPLEIIEFEIDRYGYPMNVWVDEFPYHNIPDILLLGVEHFVDSPVESPLITWIISVGDATVEFDPDYDEYDFDMEIPEYLHPYINIYQGEYRGHPEISALMCWIMFMNANIPDLLWTEHDVFRSSSYRYLPLDTSLAVVNPLGTWLVFRPHQPIDDRLIHLLPSLMERRLDAHNTIVHYIRSSYTYPFPAIVQDKMEYLIETKNDPIRFSNYPTFSDESRWSFLCNWKKYRPNEPVPPILYKEKYFWQLIVFDNFLPRDREQFEWLWAPDALSDYDVERLLRIFPEDRWSDMVYGIKNL